MRIILLLLSNFKEVRKHLHHFGENTIKSSEANTFNFCPLLSKPPYYYNACPNRRCKCGYMKATYIAKTAQKEYKKPLVDSREGIPLNKEEFYQMDKIITEGLDGKVTLI